MDEKKKRKNRINHHKGDIRREMAKSHLAFHIVCMHTERQKDWHAQRLDCISITNALAFALAPSLYHFIFLSFFAEINHEYRYPSVWCFFFFNKPVFALLLVPFQQKEP